MKFLHIADAHLDSPFIGLRKIDARIGQQLYQAPFEAFKQMVTYAIANQVDFIIIAGDTFDANNQSLSVQWFLQQQFQKLADAQIPVYLIYGNHDYKTANQKNLDYPDNVFVFPATVQTFRLRTDEGYIVDLSGFSYDQMHVTEDRLADYPMRASDADFSIGILHGSEMRYGGKDYAPFRLDELLAKHYDYWALGHIHQRQVLNQQPLVIYPGNLQGRNKDERGQKGFYEINSQGAQLKATFHNVAPFLWQSLTVDSKTPLNVPEVVAHIKHMVTGLPRTTSNLLSIKIENTAIDSNTQDSLRQDQLLQILQEEFRNGNDQRFDYPIDVTLTIDQTPDLPQLDQAYWDKAGKKVFQLTNVQELLGNLNQERFLATQILTEQNLERLQQAAMLSIKQDFK
ncbi:metallophosphoesterase family protein [Agrilactobacillus fermenti]|uniref:metallophosphoesterase family protein n=1 Tax=Agrilactobacillus fermenti TaxID=2586909 RepID=UPI003A5BA29D